MSSVCHHCSQAVEPVLCCPACHTVLGERRVPLYIVTGASGTGKSTLVPQLRTLLPDWDIFDTDSIYFNGAPQDFSLWLTVAQNIAASGRPSLLCGYVMPWEVAALEAAHFFPKIHFLILDCPGQTLEDRLQRRPDSRGFDAELIQEHRQLVGQLRAYAGSEGIPLVDTGRLSPSQVARRVADWTKGQATPKAVTVDDILRSAPKGLKADWRSYLKESLARDTCPETLLQEMAEAGIGPELARSELERAQRKGEKRRRSDRQRLRSWVQVSGELAALHPGFGKIERKHRPSSQEFLADHYSRNYPVVLTGLMEDWPAFERWTPEYLKQACGDYQVRVQPPPFSKENHTLMGFHSYVDQIHAQTLDPKRYMYSDGRGFDSATNRVLLQDVRLYEEYLSPRCEGHVQMLYGPQGALTPLHQDGLSTLLSQVKGRKKVYLIPPYQSAQVYDDGTHFCPVDCANPDLKRFPRFAEATLMEVTLDPGEVLFLPVGWWHQVHSLEVCISISFENFHYPNPHFQWEHPGYES